jgi:transposase-like protein
MKNKYVRRSKISEDKFRKIIKYFVLDLDVLKIASLTSLNRNTIHRYLIRIRERIYAVCVRQSPFDHQAFIQDPIANGGAPIFGLKENGPRVHTDIIPIQSAARLRHCLRANGDGRRICLPARWACYDCIVDMESKRLYGLSAPDRERDAMCGRVIEDFLGFTQKRMLNLHLSVLEHFGLYLKECEFRFNHREDDIYQLLLKMFREHPLA